VRKGHPLVEDEQKREASMSLSGDNFAETKGFVVKFNLQGVQTFLKHKHFSFLSPYFKSIRLSDCNAFVCNVLICNETKNSGSYAVGMHVDNTVGIQSSKCFMAHQVDVLYMNVPSDMQGGELELFHYTHPEWGSGTEPPTEGEWVRDPDEVVRPKQNMHVAFRGDSWHRVRGFTNAKAKEVPRISLVCEQYKIDEMYYPQVCFSNVYTTHCKRRHVLESPACAALEACPRVLARLCLTCMPSLCEQTVQFEFSRKSNMSMM